MAATTRVLIVDDAPPVRMLLRGYLQKLGISESCIRVAADGQEGLEAFQAEAPDVAFVDIEMPRMGGEETARAMLDVRPELKVIIMSAVDAADDRVRGLRSFGAFAVLPKPVRLEHVREILELIQEESRNTMRIR